MAPVPGSLYVDITPYPLTNLLIIDSNSNVYTVNDRLTFYRVEVPDGTTITISADGYVSQTITVTDITSVVLQQAQQTKYVSNLSDGTNTYVIKDANAVHTEDVTSTYSQTGTDPVNGTAVASAVSGKQNTITGGATTITSSDLTASRALVSNSSGKVAVSATTSTELGYVSGVTSAIQTQLNNKADVNLSNLTSTGKTVITSQCVPKYSSVVACSWNTDTTATHDGFVTFNVFCNAPYVTVQAVVNSVELFITSDNQYGMGPGWTGGNNQGYFGGSFLVKKGDTFKVYGGSSLGTIKFYPLYGDS